MVAVPAVVVRELEPLERARRGPLPAVPAWALDQGQARVEGALDPVALKGLPVLVLVMELAIAA